MLGRAVSTLDHEGFVGQGFPFFEGLHLRVIIVECVSPVAILVDGEGAVVTLDLSLGLEHRFAVIDIGGDQLAAGGEGDIFFDGTLVSARGGNADGGDVVGAGDGNGHRGRGTLVATRIGGNIGKGDLSRLTLSQGLKLGGGNILVAAIGIEGQLTALYAAHQGVTLRIDAVAIGILRSRNLSEQGWRVFRNDLLLIKGNRRMRYLAGDLVTRQRIQALRVTAVMGRIKTRFGNGRSGGTFGDDNARITGACEASCGITAAGGCLGDFGRILPILNSLLDGGQFLLNGGVDFTPIGGNGIVWNRVIHTCHCWRCQFYLRRGYQ